MVTAFQQKFSDDNEYAIVDWGQSTARPWGDRDSEGITEALHLSRSIAGKDLTVASYVHVSGTPGAAGAQSLLIFSETLFPDEWKNAELRLFRTEFADATQRVQRAVLTPVGATAALDGNGNLVITQAGGETAPNKYFQVGDQIRVSGWTIVSGDSINARFVCVAVDATTITLHLLRGTFSAINATATATALLFFQSPVTYGVGTVLSNTANGALVSWTTANDAQNSGAATLIKRKADGSSYWKELETVRVLQPYLPEVAGDYPDGAPTLPGLTLPAEMDSYSKLGLFQSYAWEEGVDGPGVTGVIDAVATGSITDAAQDMLPHLYAGGWVVVRDANGKNKGYAAVDDNTATEVTYTNWNGDPPAVGDTMTVWAPHHRDHPMAARHGYGFRRPSGDPQPTPFSSTGNAYCRPEGRLIPGYNWALRYDHACDASINTSRVARMRTSAMTAARSGNGGTEGPYRLRITRSDSSHNAAGDAPQPERFLRLGDVVQLTGWTINSGLDINGLWRVKVVEWAVGADGGYVDLAPEGGQTVNGSTTIDATAVSTSSVTRVVYRPLYRFGHMVELAFRISTLIGKRVHVIHLAVNAASQFLHQADNYAGFKGTLGWWDWRKHQDWTPGNPDGCAARLRTVLRDMAPHALEVEGSAKPLKVIGIFGFQGEADSMLKVGRETFGVSLRTFYDWLRAEIASAGLAPASGTIPIVHPRITTTPWEQPIASGGMGDVNGEINAAIMGLAADSSAKFWTFDPDTHPKLNGSVFGTDNKHFNGVGEAKNGAVAAATWAAAVGESL